VRWDILLAIISRICEYTRIETAPNPITAVNHNAMDIGLQEFVIENDCPLGVIQFSVTMRHEWTVWPLPTNALCRKGLEGVRELPN
jgi:hypothetical protein